MTFGCPSNLIKISTGLKGPLIPGPIGRKQLVYHAVARTSWTTRSGPSGSCKDRPASRSWGHRLSLEICVVNGYFLQSFWSNNWLVGWAILIYGVRCGHRGLLTRLVEAAQAGCSWRDLEGSRRSRAVDRVDDCRGGGLDPPRGSVSPRRHSHCETGLLSAAQTQYDSARHRPTLTHHPSSPATYFIFGTPSQDAK